MLKPYAAELIKAFPVGASVGNVRNTAPNWLLLWPSSIKQASELELHGPFSGAA